MLRGEDKYFTGRVKEREAVEVPKYKVLLQCGVRWENNGAPVAYKVGNL